MEEEKIEDVKSWPKPKSVKDIQVFLSFANFYKKFIKNFDKIALSPTLILWITKKSIGNKLQSTQAKNQES